MKTKLRMKLEIKEISAEGTFEGLLSPYGNVDGGGDVVEPGAYTKTLKDQGNVRPMLWQHKTDVPIGDLTLDDRPDGLWCKGALLMALPEAQKAYLLIKARIVKGLSIGFEAIQDSVQNGVRRLKEIKLYEGSIVTFPMNESALITSIKARKETKGDFNEELAEIQLSDARYQMMGALSCALSSVIWADLNRDEKITAAEATIQQFSDAFMGLLPAYLDMLTQQYGAMETWNQKLIETKSGRKISAANKETLKAAHAHMDESCKAAKSAMDAIFPLFDDGAEEEDDEEKSKPLVITPPPAAGSKPEPVSDHSAFLAAIDKFTKEITWTPSSRN